MDRCEPDCRFPRDPGGPASAAQAENASVTNISSTRAVMSEADTFAYAAAKGGSTR